MSGATRYAKGGIKLAIGATGQVELQPRVFRLRIRRALFDIDKTFLRPESLASIKLLCRFYKKYSSLNVLINGHTDSDAPADYNLQLSRERAQSMADYLRDNVDGWFAWYGAAAAWNKRWATREDQHMLWHLRDQAGQRFLDHEANGALDGPTKKAIEHFQAERGLSPKIKGAIDDDTRKLLIRSYMAEDETTLPGEAKLSFHGCGEYNLDVQTADGVSEARNRRVEVFLFEDEVDPAVVEPCPKASCPYHEWKKASVLTVDLDKEPGSLRIKVYSDGKAVEGVTVTAAGPETFSATTGAGESGALFDLLVAGSYRLTASKPGFKSVSDGNVVQVGEGGESSDVMIMVALGELRVKAVRPRDKKEIVEGATITIKGPTEPQALGESIAEEKTGKTDGTGVATFKDLQTGTYEIRATHPTLQFGEMVTAKVEATGTDATIELFQELMLKVLTYNVMFLPTLGALQPIDYYNDDRRPLLAAKILEIAADVITFDELFENSSREVLLELIRSGYPEANQSSVVDRGPSLEDGGVVVVSRDGTTLQDVDQHIYEADADDDHLSAKGIKYAIVTISGQRIHFFASHTQADYPEKGKLYSEVRKLQFDEMHAFIAGKNIPVTEPILVCGDLNVDLHNSAELSDMCTRIEARFEADRTGWEFTNDETDNDIAKWRAVSNDKRPAQYMFYYDYVLPIEGKAKDRIVPTKSSLETVKVRTSPPLMPDGPAGPTFRDLSDHYALVAMHTYRF